MIENIRPFELSFGNRKYITFDYHQKLKQTQIKENDLLMVRIGVSTGVTAVVSKDIEGSNISGNITRIVLKNGNNSKYVATFLNSNLGYELTRQIVSNTARDFLTIGKIKSIKIPLPPRKIQEKLASLMDKAYKIKKVKESESESIFQSIEPHVLEELGIKIPEIEGKSPNVFSVTAGILQGGRLDPFHYIPKFTLIEKALDRCKYPLKNIGDIISGSIVNGLDARKFVAAGTKYLRVGNIKPDRIDETDIKFVNIPIENVKKDIKLEPGDVLLTRKGTFGVSAVIGDVRNYIISSEIICLRLRKEEVNPFYFSIVNNTSVIQEQYKQKAVGAIMGSLSQEVLKTVRVPIPPRPVQDKIVKEFQERKKKARKLKGEANELLEKAKREVEEFIEKNQVQ